MVIKNIPAVDALRNAWQSLEGSAVESPRRAAEIILSEVLGIRIPEIYLQRDIALGSVQYQDYFDMVEKYKQGEPLTYVVGNVEFMGLELVVPRGVFIPRPETEMLCENVLGLMKGQSPLVMADICTGCGAIAITLASFRDDLICYGTDISSPAVDSARLNAMRLGVSDRVTFFRGDLAQVLNSLNLEGKLDCLLANPPYVREEEMGELPPGVRDHEPAAALDGGEDGLKMYGPILEEASFFLKAGGLVALEVGDGQAEDVKEMFTNLSFSRIEIGRDLCGIPRFVTGFKRKGGRA